MKTIALYVVVGFSGIIFVAADEQGDVGCDHRTFLSTCCSNNIAIIHNTFNKICSACIGRRLCRPKCPQGYYGEQCNETCTCNADECDDVSGCITTEKASTSVDEKSTDEQQGKPLGLVLKIS
ncbi:EGF-like and EMI domain-containing protein 1 isoform X3 [Crassostrea angulata]|uniref:EGF-like and EMI domain-containing protein 1 isoform X3 n=1 Tax=Magallana angulata TaxID=2784310 RepID=UPI0022B0D633|nr:EGF-like and EMI domain-containing protein 1 isoform X3 [Crassostrea angulata]